MSLATLEKTITIEVDSTTIIQDIQLLFAFKDMAGGEKYDEVAWRVADAKYNPPTKVNVPVTYKATLAFSIASVSDGKYIIPGFDISMNLEDNVDVVVLKDQQTFKDRAKAGDLKPNQIRASNKSVKPVCLAVGFLDVKDNFESAAFIPALGDKNSWIATYTPHMKLYITSNAKAGQIISTIVKSDLVYEWKMDDDVAVPNNSRWVLYKLSSGEYKIKPE